MVWLAKSCVADQRHWNSKNLVTTNDAMQAILDNYYYFLLITLFLFFFCSFGRWKAQQQYWNLEYAILCFIKYWNILIASDIGLYLSIITKPVSLVLSNGVKHIFSEIKNSLFDIFHLNCIRIVTVYGPH